MDEIGTYADDPAGRLSFLGGQMLRAYRIVIDIGPPLELPIPPGEAHGSGSGASWWSRGGWGPRWSGAPGRGTRGSPAARAPGSGPGTDGCSSSADWPPRSHPRR